MLTEKQTTNIATAIFLIPIIGIIALGLNFYNEKNCLKFGKFYNIETRERFFQGCQFKEKDEWKAIKKFQSFKLPVISFAQDINIKI
jgi:hypothetical protein